MYTALMPLRHTIMLLCLLLLACAPKPYIDYDTAFAFQQARSYFMLPPSAADDPLVTARVSAAIVEELGHKGLTAAASAERADITVRFLVGAEQRPNNTRISIGLGTGSYGSRGGASVGGAVSAPVGADTLLFNSVQIDMFAGASDELVWRASDAFEVKGSPENRAESARRLVQRLLTNFPPARP